MRTVHHTLQPAEPHNRIAEEQMVPGGHARTGHMHTGVCSHSHLQTCLADIRPVSWHLSKEAKTHGIPLGVAGASVLELSTEAGSHPTLPTPVNKHRESSSCQMWPDGGLTGVTALLHSTLLSPLHCSIWQIVAGCLQQQHTSPRRNCVWNCLKKRRGWKEKGKI